MVIQFVERGCILTSVIIDCQFLTVLKRGYGAGNPTTQAIGKI